MRRKGKGGEGTVMNGTMPPPNSYPVVLTPGPQNMTVFGDRVSKEVTGVKWDH